MKTWNYNINNEFDKFSNIKKFLNYKISQKLDYDCDVSKYAMDTYLNGYKYLSRGKLQIQYKNAPKRREKYNKHNLKWEIFLDSYQPQITKGKEANCFEKTFSGDTLNSFSTPFNYFVNWYLKKVNIENMPNFFTNKNYKWLIDNFDIIFSDYNLAEDKYCKEILEEFDVFALLTHTIGNQFPCPLYFNSYRSGQCGEYEFPDILLRAIYIYYRGIDDEIREIVNSDEHFYYTSNWLDLFREVNDENCSGWKNFVDQNYFNTYVDLEYIPIQLWNKHDLMNKELPLIGIEFYKYLKSVNLLIEERGKRIIL